VIIVSLTPLIIKDILNDINNDINDCGFLPICNKIYQYLQNMPFKDLMYNWLIHAVAKSYMGNWTIESDKTMNSKGTQGKMFIDMFSDSTLKLTFMNLQLI
jgi:capsule polysaccharide export protein KpsC/LpsZ